MSMAYLTVRHWRVTLIALVILVIVQALVFYKNGSTRISIEPTKSEESVKSERCICRDNTEKPAVGSSTLTRDDEAIGLRFKQRSSQLVKQCAVPKHFRSTRKFEPRAELLKFAFGRLRYCEIHKVGSSFQNALKTFHFSGNDKTMKQEQTERIKTYAFVREPYSRLLSGYMDRVLTWQPWWGIYGKMAITIGRPNATVHERECGNDPTFPEFVKYLIYAQETGNLRDNHFTPMHQHCDFCRTQYDFIAHLETIKEDMAFMLHSVSVNVTDMNFDISEVTLRGKCLRAVEQRPGTVKCKDMCLQLQTLWWTFQARGLISDDIKLPINGSRCMAISGDDLFRVALKAHNDSAQRINSSKQKRDVLVKLFLQVPLEDRLRLRNLYLADFELFGYDPSPPDLYPELKQRRVA